MKVCICSSFKFYSDVLNLAKKLEEAGFDALIPIPNPYLNIESEKRDTAAPSDEVLEVYWKHLKKHLKKIDDADIVYVYAKNGYVGSGVSLEIGYSHAHHKQMITSDEISDMPISCFVKTIVKPNDLVQYLQKL